ncbi:recombinase [Olleya sp. AH-315-K02]|nr:recombinase [Olleya sp. AH-315-K02]MBN4085380.1 recombinase [Flavobacteriaceae bacterium AH-315-B10]
MMKNIMKVLFTIAQYRTNNKNKSTLKCRISYNNQRKEFSTGLSINPKNWLSKQQLVKPPEPDTELINSQLSLTRTKLNQAFLFLQVSDIDFNV